MKIVLEKAKITLFAFSPYSEELPAGKVKARHLIISTPCPPRALFAVCKQSPARRGRRGILFQTIFKKGKITLFPFFPYKHTDEGEVSRRFITGVPLNAARRGVKPLQSRCKAANNRFPPSSRKFLSSARKKFRELNPRASKTTLLRQRPQFAVRLSQER